MMNLQPISGLYKLIQQLREQATANARRVRSVKTDPRMAHECAVAAEREAEEADELAKHAESNVELINKIEELIRYLANSKWQSARRTLAMRDLESASDRLRRELGDPVPSEK
jgi:hypothetical protein